MRLAGATRSVLWLAFALAAGCAGNGEGLDQNGQPIGSGGGGPLTADFASIQDNVFTPICTRCHIGASAPQGLQLDAAHSYELLVGVPSSEEPSLQRVKPGDPDHSYLVLKIQGSPGIQGGRMPLGGPYLPQSTIDTIRQWVTDGALMSQSMALQAEVHAQRAAFEVVATSPIDAATVTGPLDHIIVAFSHELDASLVNSTTVVLEQVHGSELVSALGAPLATKLRLADGNPADVIIQPVTPLGPGLYRVTLHGRGGGALADVSAVSLGADYDFVFTVEAAR